LNFGGEVAKQYLLLNHEDVFFNSDMQKIQPLAIQVLKTRSNSKIIFTVAIACFLHLPASDAF